MLSCVNVTSSPDGYSYITEIEAWTALVPPTITQSFAPASILIGGSSTLSFTLNNPNAGALTNANFTNTLSNMTVASTSLGGSCTGVTNSPALVAGATALNLTVPSLPAGGCTVTVQVTSSTVGTHPNTASGVTSAQTPTAGAASNTASLTVVSQPDPPTVTAKFEPAWMESGGQSTLRIHLASPMNVALTNVAFTGTLTGMTVASATIGGTCAGVTNSPALAVGATSLNLTVPNLPVGGCTVTVQVTGTTMGSNPMVMSGATSAESSGTGSIPPTSYLTISEDPGFMYVHADHLGTPRAITRPTDNQLVWKWDNTEPFGNNAANENPSGLGTFQMNLRHPGQYYDQEVGTFYNYFRDYDPSTGRYRQSDPIGLKGGLNTYAYVASDPLRQVDPLGLANGPGIGGMNGTKGFSIHSSCSSCEFRSDIRKQVGQWCDTLEQTITDPKLKKCLKLRCSRGEIRCDPGRECGPTDLGWARTMFTATFRYCVNNIKDQNQLGPVAIHEWAHTCGWDHGEGKGVPLNGGYGG